MPLHAVTYTYTDDVERRDAVRPVHREFLSELAAAGTLVASGPLDPDAEHPAGALILLATASGPDALAVLDADPFVVEGVVAHRAVRAWSPVIGVLSEHA